MKTCSQCGEKYDGRICPCGYGHKERAFDPNRHLCAYENNGQRCPLAGSISETSRPTEHTKFYCRYHINWFDNPRLAALNLEEILAGKVSMKKVWQEEMMEKFQADHPEFKFVPSSPADVKDLMTMTRKFVLRSFKQLPYDKTKSQIEPDYTESELLARREIV